MDPAAPVVDLIPAERDPELFTGQDEGFTGVRAVWLDQVGGREGRELPAQGGVLIWDRVRPGAHRL